MAGKGLAEKVKRLSSEYRGEELSKKASQDAVILPLINLPS